MSNDIFPKPQIPYSDILTIVEQLNQELNNENFKPFDIKLEIESLTERRRKNYIRRLNLDLSIKLFQIKEYIVICQTYKTMATTEQAKALKQAKVFMATWKGVVTRKQFRAYQYMLGSMLNLPITPNKRTIEATQEIMANPYLSQYVKDYDEQSEKITWQAKSFEPHLGLLERFSHHK